MNDPISLLVEKILTWYELFILNLPNFVIAITILSTSYVLSSKVQKNIHIPKRINLAPSLSQLFSNVLGLIILGIGIIFSLDILNLDQAASSLLAGAGIVGLAVGFALQDIMANFISGIIIIAQHPFRVGDLIEVKGYFGILKKIDLRTIQIRTLDGQNILIPNKEVFTSSITNYTQIKSRRVDIICGVGYETDLEMAKKLTIDLIKELNFVDKEQPIELFYEEFGNSAISYQLRFWVDFTKQPDYLEAKSVAIMEIKKAYEKAKIDIPFPIQTVLLHKDKH